MSIALLFFQLMIAHAVADFVLQPGPMSAGKNRHNDLSPKYGPNFPPWYYWLSAHALTHAGAVYLVTGSALCALLELVSHWWIDYSKCERWIGFHQDQCIHLLFKLLYCGLIAYGLAGA